MLRITEAPLFSERTTLRLGGPALAEVSLDEAVDAYKLGPALRNLGGSPLVLGAGSNILAADGRHDLVLVRPRFMNGPSIVEDDGKQVLVRVGAGLPLPVLLSKCARWSLSGLEGLCGIPGTVGGAVAMNAGSFGCETGPLVHSVRLYSPATGVVDIDAEYMHFSYRSFKVTGLTEWFLLLQVIFGLTRSERNVITQIMRHNFFKKKSTQPVKAWSAGCVFKNPSAVQPAGMLLEQAGFKGRRLGGMAFSDIHANFLINEGQGSATAALELMEQAREAVLDRFGVRLEPEVRVLACPTS